MDENINRCVASYRDRLLKQYAVNGLSELPADVLSQEITKAKVSLANYDTWGGELEPAEYEQYIISLEKALYGNEIPDVVEYTSLQVKETLKTYEVKITETYQKTVCVKAPDDGIAAAYVKDLYDCNKVMLDTEHYIGTEFTFKNEVNCKVPK